MEGSQLAHEFSTKWAGMMDELAAPTSRTRTSNPFSALLDDGEGRRSRCRFCQQLPFSRRSRRRVTFLETSVGSLARSNSFSRSSHHSSSTGCSPSLLYVLGTSHEACPSRAPRPRSGPLGKARGLVRLARRQSALLPAGNGKTKSTRVQCCSSHAPFLKADS